MYSLHALWQRQIAAGIVVLALAMPAETCDNPLYIYVIGQVLRLIVSLPLVLHQHMYPHEANVQRDRPTRVDRYVYLRVTPHYIILMKYETLVDCAPEWSCLQCCGSWLGTGGCLRVRSAT